MALRALMLRKKIDGAKKDLEALRTKTADFEKRETELEAAIDEAQTDEERSAVEDSVNAFEAERAEHETAVAGLEESISKLEADLSEEEARDAEKLAQRQAAAQEQTRDSGQQAQTRDSVQQTQTREESRTMGAAENRGIPFSDKHYIRAAMGKFVARDDVKEWIGSIRDCIANKRAITNVGLTIPEVVVGLIRENVENYSKLYKHLHVVQVSGKARQLIGGSFPEGIWTECCGILNELSIGFNDVEVDCYKVGGYIKVCNAALEDSDIALSSYIVEAITQAIGLALDKAILYGRNASTTLKMPMGVMSRLVQTSQPADYPATARPWVDLHTSNIKSIGSSVTGIELFKALMIYSGAMKGKYSRGEKVWVMNEATYTYLKAQAMSVNAAGAIVSGFEGTMPVLGGVVEVLEFIPDNVIIGGYFDLYLLAERAGSKFASSEHAFFIQDQTVFKGTARYDGDVAIAEGFIAIGVNGTTPNSTMTFAPDTANAGE